MGWIVRRLTPTECERLQGFPDGYTAIQGASDTARYKALGNSMAVPVMAWIGQRIQAVEDEEAEQMAAELTHEGPKPTPGRMTPQTHPWAYLKRRDVVEVGRCGQCVQFAQGNGFTYCRAISRTREPGDYCSRFQKNEQQRATRGE